MGVFCGSSQDRICVIVRELGQHRFRLLALTHLWWGFSQAAPRLWTL